MTFPFDFDTSGTWRKIAAIGLIVVAVWALAIVKFILTAQWAAAVGALAIALIWYSLFRRIPRSAFSMGAAGRLTKDEVAVRAVRVWRFPLRVPVGRFALSQFGAIRLTERVVVRRSSGPPTNSGSVELVGRGGAPDIQLMLGPIDAAEEFARDASATLGLELQRAVPAGTRIIKVNL